ncbi:hypothetical protein Neosp_012348 [[Neocosmospora] mangrovei]
MLSHDSEIIIVGGGVFGLSSALWLARGGYRNITIFDRCAFDKNGYDPSRGCDGASADINKVFRMAYAERTDYQDLAIEARDFWLSWNKAITEANISDLPGSLTPEDKLFYICGSYFLAEGPELRDYYADSLKTMEKTAPEFRKMQFVKACIYAKFLCEQVGVKFVLGDPKGKLSSLIIENDGLNKRVAGIKTCDGLRHFGDLVIVAAGSWTASIIPEAHQTVEATAGTVMFIDIPKHRQDLWKKFHPDNYPVWSYRRGEGEESVYSIFTRDVVLTLMLATTRVVDSRSPKKGDSSSAFAAVNRVSTPRTKYTEKRINTVPLYGLSRMKEVISQAFPELAEFGFTDSRLCWYTDSIDNDYVIDYVPGYSDSLFICTGGSGHAFKFLPVLGKHVKNQIERVPDQFTSVWKWRVAQQGKPNNGLSEGEDGPREMSKLEMASAQDFKMKRVPMQKL